MTSDCYAILGVTPAAEDVVIGAAYRALMRHYHPDTNPDPAAQARAQQISAAYAVLRDPARRAEYDAQRGADRILWDVDEPAEQPPPMRTAGIATALLAVVLVGAVWAWPRPAEPPGGLSSDVAAADEAVDPKAEKAPPAATRNSPMERLATASVRPPVPTPTPDIAPEIKPPVVAPPKPVELASVAPLRSRPRVATSPAPAPTPAQPAAAPAQAKAAEPKPAGDNRVATLDRMSAGFFSQSMVHANEAKKTRLLAARDRSAAQRKTCRSDTCVADAYLRYIRETSAIMEGRPGPK